MRVGPYRFGRMREPGSAKNEGVQREMEAETPQKRCRDNEPCRGNEDASIQRCTIGTSRNDGWQVVTWFFLRRGHCDSHVDPGPRRRHPAVFGALQEIVRVHFPTPNLHA